MKFDKNILIQSVFTQNERIWQKRGDMLHEANYVELDCNLKI